MADASCTIEQKKDADGSPLPLHVGDIFLVRCEGNFPRLDMNSLEFRADEKDKYTLKIFQVQQPSSSELQLQATSYMVGDHDLKLAQITDSSNSIVLNGLRFKVESVQNPQNPAKEPYPPVGPLSIFPWIVLILIAAGIVVLVSLFIGEMLLIRRRRELMKDINTRVFQYAALPEFFRNLRSLQRQYPFLSDPSSSAEPEELKKALNVINNEFRIYLARMYRLPIHRWSTSRSLRDLKKSMGAEHLRNLKIALYEVDRALSSKAKLGALDLDQIQNLVRIFVEQDAEIHRKAEGVS